jgi:hypothetical protein
VEASGRDAKYRISIIAADSSASMAARRSPRDHTFRRPARTFEP